MRKEFKIDAIHLTDGGTLTQTISSRFERVVGERSKILRAKSDIAGVRGSSIAKIVGNHAKHAHFELNRFR